MILPIIVISVICILFTIPAYAENLDYSISGKYNDYKIKLDFIDGFVQGKITSDNEIITLDNPKIIERGWEVLIIDRENNLMILSKKVIDDKYIILVKIKPDTKLRFIGIIDTVNKNIETIDVVNKNIGQRDLLNAVKEKQKLDEELRIKNMSFRELELYKKQQLIEKSSMQFEDRTKRLTENSYKKTFGTLTRDSILADYEKSQIKTGMDLVVNKKTIKPKVTIIDNRILHVLTSHYERVSNNQNQIFKFEVKTFDKNVYSGIEWDKFDGQIDDVLINGIIKDSDGNIKKEFSGYTKYGIFEATVKIERMNYPQGNYSLEIDVPFNEQKFDTVLYFTIYEESTSSFNNPPIANAGIDGHFPSGTLVELDGSNSFDSDDITIYYNWNQLDGETVILSNNEIVNPSFTIPDIFDSFYFELIVNDGRKDSLESDIVEITSLHADAGEDQTVQMGLVTLNGSKSGDTLVDHKIDYLWTVLTELIPTNSNIVELIGNTTDSPKFTPDQFGNYTFQLEFSDDRGLIDIDNVTINVKR